MTKKILLLIIAHSSLNKAGLLCGFRENSSCRKQMITDAALPPCDVSGCDWPLPCGSASGCSFKKSLWACSHTGAELNPESNRWPQSEENTSTTANMVDSFVGTWKMISSDNFDDYMKAIGKRELHVLLTLEIKDFKIVGFAKMCKCCKCISQNAFLTCSAPSSLQVWGLQPGRWATGPNPTW